jgi:hypothetical protein
VLDGKGGDCAPQSIRVHLVLRGLYQRQIIDRESLLSEAVDVDLSIASLNRKNHTLETGWCLNIITWIKGHGVRKEQTPLNPRNFDSGIHM